MPRHPDIIVSQEDHERLVTLALNAIDQAPGAPMLLAEMERAKVVEARALPADVLAMNDRAWFEYDGRAYRDVQLVFPQHADFADGRISVLTPVGAALIGLGEGQSIWWPDRQRGVHRLTVTRVSPRRAH